MQMTRRTAAADDGACARRPSTDRMLVQPVRQPGGSRQGAVGAGAEPAAAPKRPHSRTWSRPSRATRSTKKGCSRTSPRRGRDCSAPRRPSETIQAANQQTSALGRLLAVVENYPQLKANEQFNRLMDELSGTENRIAVERMRYNERVQEYNTSRRQFPANITAKLFSFKEYPFFEAPPEAKQVPKVTSRSPEKPPGGNPATVGTPAVEQPRRLAAGARYVLTDFRLVVM